MNKMVMYIKVFTELHDDGYDTDDPTVCAIYM